jgi:transketolase
MTDFAQQVTSSRVRRLILEQAMRAHVGHIGSALSIADIITTLYSGVLNLPGPNDPDRDRFILSNGHAVLALYAALFLRGCISEQDLNTYSSDLTLLGIHPEHRLDGIDFSTGSLGQGLSYGVGAALAARWQHSRRRVFVLVSDAECNEGALWEAVMFAAHHRLANLTCIIDLNGQQALGYTDQVLSLSPMEERWRAFGWDVHTVDGHNIEQMRAAFSGLDTHPVGCSETSQAGAPHVLVAHTVFGCGVSFMRHQIKWHYWPMSAEEYASALAEIGGEG